jgi:hypothetical protein
MGQVRLVSFRDVLLFAGGRLAKIYEADRRNYPTAAYRVQMTAAVSLALFVAFYLQLDRPSCVGTTAAIYSHNP